MAFNKNLSKCSLYESEATIDHGSMMEEDDTESCYFEAFQMFTTKKPTISVNDLLYAMRTAGANPTESELQVDSREQTVAQIKQNGQAPVPGPGQSPSHILSYLQV